MFVLHLFDLVHGFVLELGELELPVMVELVQLFVTDLDVLGELLVLDVSAEDVLVRV